MRFDIHAHVNTVDVARYPTDPVDGHLPASALTDALPGAALVAAMDANLVERAVVVQRCHVYGFDNRYTLDMAAAYPDRLRALCVIDGRADDAVAAAMQCLDRGAVGIRYMEPERGHGFDWLAGENARAAWRTTVERGASMRVHLFRWNRADGLAVIANLLDEMPHTRLVIDHMTNLDSANDDLGIDAALGALADRANVSLLFSTINLKRWNGEGVDAAAVVERVVALFGAGRVMWGSDTGNTLGDYRGMIARAEEAAAGLHNVDRAALFYDNAAAFYA